jgi:hypothetical protein
MSRRTTMSKRQLQNVTEDRKYAPGDRVVSYDRGGVIRKVMKYTARVRYDDDDKDETENLAALNPETAEDITRREYERAVNKWMLRKPKTSTVIVQMAHRFRGPPRVDGVLTSAKPLRGDVSRFAQGER